MAGFGFASVGHFFATAFSDLHKALKFTEAVGQKIDTPKVENTVEAITALVPNFGGTAVAIERGAFALLGEGLAAVHALDDAQSANGVSVTLDAALVASLKALIATGRDDLAKLGYKL